MSRVLPLLLLTTLAACATGDHRDGPVYRDKAHDGRGADQVAVCHKGKKTLVIAEPAVDAHLGHGDHLGRCR